ncbi:MAG TPA: putative lipid II flippase FtsW [Gaiellaceae bacterium]|jgi:cell division protein FtsW|nr:putative lipid II flippase FtsW [Gaiellaceae bacterium]
MRRRELDSRLLIMVTLALVAFGIVMVYSATSAPAAVGGGNPTYYLERQSAYAALGIVLMILAQRWDYRRLKKLAPPLVLVSLVMLAAVLVVGQAINGARRWVSFGPAVFQPSEVAKLSLAIWASAYFAKRRPPRDLRELWRPVGALTCVFCVLLILEPDLGTTIALAIMLVGILLVSGTPARVVGSAVTIASTAGLAAIWMKPYSRSRFFAFLHPSRDAAGTGYQILQAKISIGSGGLFGVGIGNGIGKVFYLPEASTDMMAANIGEELGLVGLAAVILAYALFAYAGLDIAKRCKDPFGKRLAAGLTVLVCGQAAVNLLAVMGLAPLTGIPLPFLSYGGSSLVVLLAAVGILLNIAQRGSAAAASVSDRSRGDGRTRPARARGSGGADRSRRARDVRRVAGSRRSAAGS